MSLVSVIVKNVFSLYEIFAFYCVISYVFVIRHACIYHDNSYSFSLSYFPSVWNILIFQTPVKRLRKRSEDLFDFKVWEEGFLFHFDYLRLATAIFAVITIDALFVAFAASFRRTACGYQDAK